MKIQRLDEQTLVLEEIDEFCTGLLKRIPESGDPAGSEAAEARLFPDPTSGDEPDADEDWSEYVRPELEALFRDSVSVVEEDLKDFPANPAADAHALRIPTKHLDAWIHALNQARLALAARHAFTEAEINREVQWDSGARGVALFQVHFYGLLQEFFLRQLE